MFRLIKMSGKWYALKIYNLEDDADNIRQFVDEGTMVLLTDDVECAADELGIDLDEIELVE